MKILFLNALYAPHIGGGAEITLQTLVHGLRDRGHEVVVLATGPKAGLIEEEAEGVRVIRAGIKNVYWPFLQTQPPAWKRLAWHLRDSYNPAMARVVEEVIGRERPDVVSCHNLAGFSAATWGAIRCRKVPVVQVLHDQYNICPNRTMFRQGYACSSPCLRCRVFRCLHPRLSNSVDAVVGVSRFILDFHLARGFFSEVKISRAIHNVRRMELAPSPAARPDDKVRFGFIGTLSPAKGAELLLETFLSLNLPNAELYVAGTGEQEYEAVLRRRYGNIHIHFLGYARSLDFFRSTDLLVVPSICHDTLPGVIFEAFSCGVPVLASLRGGIPEMIQDGVNGFLFEPTRPEELSALMLRLANEPEVIEAMRPAALAAAEPFLDVNRWLDSYEHLYREVIAACAR